MCWCLFIFWSNPTIFSFRAAEHCISSSIALFTPFLSITYFLFIALYIFSVIGSYFPIRAIIEMTLFCSTMDIFFCHTYYVYFSWHENPHFLLQTICDNHILMYITISIRVSGLGLKLDLSTCFNVANNVTFFPVVLFLFCCRIIFQHITSPLLSLSTLKPLVRDSMSKISPFFSYELVKILSRFSARRLFYQ